MQKRLLAINKLQVLLVVCLFRQAMLQSPTQPNTAQHRRQGPTPSPWVKTPLLPLQAATVRDGDCPARVRARPSMTHHPPILSALTIPSWQLRLPQHTTDLEANCADRPPKSTLPGRERMRCQSECASTVTTNQKDAATTRYRTHLLAKPVHVHTNQPTLY